MGDYSVFDKNHYRIGKEDTGVVTDRFSSPSYS